MHDALSRIEKRVRVALLLLFTHTEDGARARFENSILFLDDCEVPAHSSVRALDSVSISPVETPEMGATTRAMAACCGRIERACDSVVGVIGPPMFIFGLTLIIGIAHSSARWTHEELRMRGRERMASACDVVVWTCAVNAVFNHVMCAMTRPGSPKDAKARRAIERASAPSGDGADPESRLKEVIERGRYCETCDVVKPDMTHHCSVCRRCVLKMDHHCPWVMNCVGARNYRFFFNFIAYAWLGCLTVSLAGAAVLFEREYPIRHVTSEETFRGVIFVSVMAVAVFAALSFLVSWQAYLALTGQTTIDYYTWSDARKALKARGMPYGEFQRPPFHQGSRAKNWQEAFDERGRFWYVAWCLPRLRAHSGSGVYYEAHGPRALAC